MKCSEAIKLLEKLIDKHGDVELFFDCPECDKSFTPTKVVASAVHIKATDGAT